MDSEILVLCYSSAAVAVVHTLIGPDHYVPFVAMARARAWSPRRTAVITVACGVGHIGSSVGLGLAAALLGVEIQRIAQIESLRGSIATWALIVFGALYFTWGLRRAGKRHSHVGGHTHAGTGYHVHEHDEAGVHPHAHDQTDAPAGRARGASSLTPWVLFAIFVFGPCEPLIPLVMYPAAKGDWLGTGLVTTVFGGVTLLTMLAAVLLGLKGVQRLRFGAIERYAHALAGLTLLLTGGAMAVFGL